MKGDAAMSVEDLLGGYSEGSLTGYREEIELAYDSSAEGSEGKAEDFDTKAELSASEDGMTPGDRPAPIRPATAVIYLLITVVNLAVGAWIILKARRRAR